METDTENQESSKPSETAQESRTLTEALYLLNAQWSSDNSKMYGKRMALLEKLKEVGPKRLIAGIKACCQGHHSEFFPSQAVINTYIPSGEKEVRDEGCKCKGTGFIMVSDFEARKVYGHTSKCKPDCRLAHGSEAMIAQRCQCRTKRAQ